MRYEVRRSPFFLYPDLPATESDPRPQYPLPWGERLDALYGPGARSNLARLGGSVGFRFNFSAPGSSTFDSHRLMMWAEEQGKGVEFGKATARAYFEDAKPLADHDVLAQCAEEVGVQGAVDVLKGAWGRDRVIEAVRFAQRLGIRSIPVFLFEHDGGFQRTVDGSADAATFATVFRDILEHCAAR